MAKKSKIVREYKLMKNIQKYSALRAELKDIIKNPNSLPEDKRVAVAKLDTVLALENFDAIPDDINFGIKSSVLKRFLKDRET